MSLTNQQKKYAVWAGAVAAIGGAAYFLTLSTDPVAPLQPPEITSLTGGFDTRQVSLEGLARRITDLEDDRAVETRDLSETLARLESSMNSVSGRVDTALRTDPDKRQEQAISSINGRIAGLERVLREMQRQIDERPVAIPQPIAQTSPVAEPEPVEEEVVEVAPPPPPPPEQNPQPLYEAPPELPLQSQSLEVAALPAPGITQYEPEDAPQPTTLAESIPPLIVPAGSVITTVMLTGLDAPTGVEAQDNPMPVLLRIKKEALMPNEWYGDVVDCHLLGGAYGELASNRVNIRGELASCVLSDGSVVEQPVKFFATGSDGKVGVHGNLVSKAGQALARAALAGFAEGMATAAATPDIGTGINAGGLLTAGAAGGATNAFNQLSQYYIDLAEETFPVIEVPNGQWVDVVLTSRLEISFDGAS